MNFEEIRGYIEPLLQNEFFVGIVLAGILTGLFYSLRSIPRNIWEFVKWKTLTVLTVNSTDDIFPWIDKWLIEETKYGEKCHRLRINEVYNGLDESPTVLGVGVGTHYFIHNRAPIKVVREVLDDAKTGSFKLNEKMTFTSPSKKAIIGLFNEAHDLSKHREDMKIYTSNTHGFCEVRGISPRPLDTIYCEGDSIEEIVKRIDSFFKNKEWYIKRGIPWRLGIFLHGPPGTGKSSVARALASYFNKSLYVVHLGSMYSDSSLFSNMREVQPNSFVLMEDIDCAGANAINSREKKDQPETGSIANDNDEESSGISLSALLNSIDGVMAPEGRVLIMTSNHPEKIDPALLREGRVDIRVELGKIGPSEIHRMLDKIFDVNATINEKAIKRLYDSGLEWTPSYAQEVMIRAGNRDRAIDQLIENPR